MRKKRKIIFSLLLILTITTLFISHELLSSKELKTIVSNFVNSKDYASANEITFLDTPTGLTWKEGSTATAKWNAVENANYYLVNIFLYDENGNLIGTRETGTSNTELDIQQEINSILSETLSTPKICNYSVLAMYIYDDKEIISKQSEISIDKFFESTFGKTIVSKPTNLVLNDDKTITFDSIDGKYIRYYTIYTKIKYNNNSRTVYGYHSVYNPVKIAGTENTYRANIAEALKYAYDDAGYNGEVVEISYALRPGGVTDEDNYKVDDHSLSSYSEFSNYISYSENGKTIVSKPTNLVLNDDKTITFDSIDGKYIRYYTIYTKIKYNNNSRTVYGYHSVYNPVKVAGTENTYRANIADALKYAYDDAGYNGEVVEISYALRPGGVTDDNNYKVEDHSLSSYSEFSNYISYSEKGKTIVSKPINLVLNDDKTITFDSIDGKYIRYYTIYTKIKYNNNSRTVYGYHSVYNPVKVAGTENTYTANIADALKYAYDDAGYNGEVVEISYALRPGGVTDDNNYKVEDHSLSSYSEFSNYIFYIPNGSTIINDITLSPTAPVIGVGRSLYIGKTIAPENALYSIIDWSTTNDNIVSIDDMGLITGITPGKATITAKINNATQTAEVNVYEIKSNIKDKIDSSNVIDKANEIIESIISKEDISNTDITDIKHVIDEIQKGAKDGDLFNVDIKYEELKSGVIDQLIEQIKNKYKDYNIAGVNNINIEISHKDVNGKSHHIANITELEDEIGVTIDLSNSIPKLSNNKTRKYKLIRKHNDELENIDFEINNGIIETKSDKFSEFVLLYMDTDIPATGIEINKESTIINVGNKETITISILPENAANKSYTSKSSNESVATVENNIITAVAPGNATITFTSVDGNYSKTINVLVKAPLKNISLDKTTGTKNVGEIENLTVTYNPTNTTDDKNITWASSNESIAKVDSTGKVTAIAPGQATITAIVGDKTATYVVDVKQPLTSISLNKTIGSLIAEREELLTVTYNPSNTTDDKTITWTTSDQNIATVVDGYVKAISAGTVTITAKVGDKTATYELTVMPRIKLTSISLNKKTGQLNVGEDEDLVVTYNPIDTNDNKTVLWTTSNAAIATVKNGKVTAIAPGKATITATVGDKTATYIVEVKSPLIGISLNKTSGTLRVEGTETLTVTYNPSNTTDNKKVTWSSSDESIAKVENGKITALKTGKITITASVGDKAATYNLTVIEKEKLQERFVQKGFKTKNNFVHGFKLGDSLTNIKNKVELDYTTTGSNTVISTGIQFKYNEETFTAVVYGDLNGDGKINSADLLKMRQHLLGTSKLTGAYKEAGSIATGTTINSADLLRIRQHLLGQKTIGQ